MSTIQRQVNQMTKPQLLHAYAAVLDKAIKASRSFRDKIIERVLQNGWEKEAIPENKINNVDVLKAGIKTVQDKNPDIQLMCVCSDPVFIEMLKQSAVPNSGVESKADGYVYISDALLVPFKAAKTFMEIPEDTTDSKFLVTELKVQVLDL